ncbi:major facilitator superfamily domain-containing protein [Chaetomium tenue]|uniref:Major facilitator superfamily domain-containing protein n=1 Tax=Chaetomium tenue TaxID=1854479 RepID=A0ACB7P255_9PEZI|nr:major facilitator superfamily domain-containing protein [Chaetomium globosum]
MAHFYQGSNRATEAAGYPVMTETRESSLDDARLEKGVLAEAEWKPGRKEYAVIITLSVVSLMVALDATILVSVLPTLAVDLGGTATDAFWAGTSYLLTSAVCQPFIAALSDIFGRKEMLLISIFLFTLGTLLCAPIAKTFAVFFVGRSVQGIGGGGIITLSQVIFADIVPLRQRPKYFALVQISWALGSVLGPLIGGLFVEHATWAWCFYINFPFCLLGFILVPIFVKLTTAKTSLASKIARVDWLGGFLFIGGLTSFLIGISWGGVQYAWGSAQTIAPIVVGIVTVVIAIVWEIYGAREPFIRQSLFSSGSALAAYIGTFFQGFILFCALYYIPFYFTAVKFESPVRAGLDIFPATCVLLPTSIVVSRVTARIGRYRWAIWAGWVITAIGCGLLVLLDTDTPTAAWAAILVVFGVGHGMLLTSLSIGIQAISAVEDAGRAAAMYAFTRALGMSIGVAVGGSVFQNVMINRLAELGLPESIAHNSEVYVEVMSHMDSQDPVRISSLQAYVTGFRGVFWTITATAIASFFIGLAIKKFSMDKGLQSHFTLAGGRGANAPLMAASSSTMASSESHLPPCPANTPFHFNNRAESAFGPESTYSTANNSQYSQTAWQAHDGTTNDNESAVAYYIQPGGRIVSVSIQPDNRPSSRNRSTSELERQPFGAAPTGEGRSYATSPEPLLQGGRSGSQLGYYPA